MAYLTATIREGSPDGGMIAFPLPDVAGEPAIVLAASGREPCDEIWRRVEDLAPPVPGHGGNREG